MRRVGEHLAALLGIRSIESHHDRYLHVQPSQRIDDPFSDEVATRDPTEDVHEHALHAGIRGDDFERVRQQLGPRSATNVQEVGGFSAGGLHNVEGRHH
jgi:hypothetical protein